MFFDKPASKLTLAQSALIAGLPQAPVRVQPVPRLERRATTAAPRSSTRWPRPGSSPPPSAAAAAQEKLGVKHNRFYTARREQYFFDYVTAELFKKYGVKTVRQGGLKIYTTLDLKPRSRRAPRSPAASTSRAIPPRRSSRSTRATATSSPWPPRSTYGKTKFNYATQAHRQPGSTFKVMVLMTALVARASTPPARPTAPTCWRPAGCPATRTTRSRPTGTTTRARSTSSRRRCSPTTPSTPSSAPTSARAAVRETAYKMGITTQARRDPRRGARRPAARGVPARDGQRLRDDRLRRLAAAPRWRSSRSRHPDGHVDDIGKGSAKKVFSDGVTYEATKILHGQRPGGHRHRRELRLPRRRQDGHDLRLQGRLVRRLHARTSRPPSGSATPNPPIPMLSVHGIEVAGATFPAQIWHDYMNVAHGSFCGDFAPPKTPFQPQPFFGKYSRTGGSSDTDNYNSRTAPATTTRYGQQNGGTTQNGAEPRARRRSTTTRTSTRARRRPPRCRRRPRRRGPATGTATATATATGTAKPPKPGGGNGNGH